MSERFKFRVWVHEDHYSYDGADECLIEKGWARTNDEVHWINLSPDGQLIFGQCNEACEPMPESRYTVEQCTGLHDSEGTLIYEGDVLGGSEGDTMPCAVCHSESGAWVTHDSGHDLYGLIEDWPCTVIGNIHENADLLEATNDN